MVLPLPTAVLILTICINVTNPTLGMYCLFNKCPKNEVEVEVEAEAKNGQNGARNGEETVDKLLWTKTIFL